LTDVRERDPMGEIKERQLATAANWQQWHQALSIRRICPPDGLVPSVPAE
jgi:hypothetical protein